MFSQTVEIFFLKFVYFLKGNSIKKIMNEHALQQDDR